MTSYVDVSFHGLPRDVSMEAAIHRWAARLEMMEIEPRRVRVRLEPAGRKRKMVSLTVSTASGSERTTSTVHVDPYVAVGEAFRSVRQQLRSEVRPRGRALACS